MPQHTPDATEPDIQTWCAAYLRTALKLPDAPIDVHAEFASLGLDSAESVFLVAAIEDWLGLELASDTAMEHPTIAQLSRFVAGRLGDEGRAPRRRAVASLDRARFPTRSLHRWSICSPGVPRKGPHAKAFVFVPERGGAHIHLTFAELHRRARAVAAASHNAPPAATARCSCSRPDWTSSWRSSAASPRA